MITALLLVLASPAHAVECLTHMLAEHRALFGPMPTRPTEGGMFSFEDDDVVETIDSADGEVRVHYSVSGSSVTITSPTDGTVITEPEVTVTGTGTPGEEITVTANGESKTVTVGEDGTWMTTFDNLPEGDNTITAKAGDDEVTVTVTVNTDSREFILLGNGCSSTNGQPTDMLWLLVIGLVLGLRRRRQR